MTHLSDNRREAAREMVELRVGTLLDFLPDATMMVDLEGRLVVWNRAMEELTGLSRDAMIGRAERQYGVPFYGVRRPILLDFVLDPHQDPTGLYPAVQREGDTLIAEMTVYHLRGNRRCLWAKASPIRNEHGAVVGAVETVRDITDLRQTQESLRRSEERYRSLILNLPVAIDRTTPEPGGRILMANPAFLHMFGYTSLEEVQGIDPRRLYVNGEDRAAFSRRLLAEGTVNGYEMRFRRADGTPIWGAVTGRVVHEGEGDEGPFFDCIIEEITERRKQHEAIRRLAYYDALTGLPNRILFRDRLEMAIRRAERNGERVVLMMLDLDRFKGVNDSLGHPTGDLLLKGVADRMRRRLRKSDTVARLSGDEFMVIYGGLRRPEQAEAMARRLLAAFAERFDCAGRALQVTASVGIVVYPDDAADAEAMIRNVDVALYQAKGDGRDGFRRYRATA